MLYITAPTGKKAKITPVIVSSIWCFLDYSGKKLTGKYNEHYKMKFKAIIIKIILYLLSLLLKY
jgi:hypothetical protein